MNDRQTERHEKRKNETRREEDLKILAGGTWKVLKTGLIARFRLDFGYQGRARSRARCECKLQWTVQLGVAKPYPTQAKGQAKGVAKEYKKLNQKKRHRIK